MINIINSLNILGVFTNATDCGSILGEDLTNVLQDVYRAMQVAIPILVTALCTVDIVKAVAAQDDKDMEAAKSRALKRLIIGVTVMFIPILIDFLLDLAGLASGTCHIGG